MKVSSSNRRIGTLILWLLTVLASFGALPEDPAEYAEWEASMLNAISHHASRGDAQAYQKLAGYVFKMSISTNREEADRPVFSAAQQALLSLPHHAEYFRDELEKLGAEEADYLHRGASHFASSGTDRLLLYKTLQQLPSPQVAGLLGELLDDPTDTWKDHQPSEGSPRLRPNSEMACLSLMQLPILNPPVADKPRNATETRQAIEQWQIWRDQIKAGSRSLRFEGDPQAYNFAGPVRAKPAATRPNRREPLPTQEATTESDQGSLPWFSVTASLLLLLAAGGWYLTSKKAT